MISRARSAAELSRLPAQGVEAQKIRALLLAYGTKYDFCRFYASESFIFCEMNGSFVVSEIEKGSHVDELAEFLEFGGFAEIFCSEALGERLKPLLCCNLKRVELMRFCGENAKTGEYNEIDKAPSLDDVFAIIKTAFDIDYESWYVDMSHRIRHNVAGARRLGNSALTIQHDLNGEALLSQIATSPDSRSRGGASRLISAVCAELFPSSVYVICEDSLTGFYSRLGFEFAGHKIILTK